MQVVKMNQFFLFCLITIQSFVFGVDQRPERILTEDELMKYHVLNSAVFDVQRDFLPIKLKKFIDDFETWNKEDKNALKVLFTVKDNPRYPHKIGFDVSNIPQEKQTLYEGSLHNWFNNMVKEHEKKMATFTFCVIYLKYPKSI